MALNGTGNIPNPNRIKNVNMNITYEEADSIIKKYGKKRWEWFKKQEYHFDEYDENVFKREIENLKKENKGQKSGYSKVIKYYHKSMNYASKDNCPSPLDYWNTLKEDYEEFKWFLRNRLTRSDFFKRDDNWKLRDKCDIPLHIYQIGETTSRRAPEVSYLKPNLAKYLIQNYLNNCDTIFNPCHGYSAIALATLCTNMNYVGQDICDYQINEFEQMYNETILPNIDNNPICEVRVADSLKTKIDFTTSSNRKKYGKTGLLVCPPYKLIENWPNSKGEYLTKNLECTQWIEAFLKNYCCDYYCFIIDDKYTDEKYLKYSIGKTDNVSHWAKSGQNTEPYLLISKKERDKLIKNL